MMVLVKLLLAHLLGDFLLQPTKWVYAKEKLKHKSLYLYYHTLLHGVLAWIIVGEKSFGIWAFLIAITHGIIDFIKLHFQKNKTKRLWFLVDQALHVLVLLVVAYCYQYQNLNQYELDQRFWIIATGVLLLTKPTSVIIKNSISIWTPEEPENKDDSLENAGNYIGILERLFVFFFMITGHFEAIGFLLAAKSIFRFGDLKEAKDRKLTEYVLIGTLLSFGIAMLTGFLTEFILLQSL
ncbi:DUF3307 domain-containing protein [Flavobacterium sp. CYK-4]|uniref:DUF3307 domain-containing protein n=1 Tax=Flavobacterium lotistagni TaxID=2709660 RepID=UPI00140E8A7F|nr:DUF3307 domain-containing protein [Flavobacterium lotistagni]NHM07974.1 DUF3307 domain-containing protein [Flavobacterium lotistagni]